MDTAPSKDNEKTVRAERLITIIKEHREIMSEPDINIPKEALSTPESPNQDELDKILASVVLFGTHRWEITRLPLPPETKLDWEGLMCKDRWTSFYGVITHPSLDKIIDNINQCLGAATVAAIAAGLLTMNLPAALAAFKGSLISCLKLAGCGWASELTIWIETKDEAGSWHPCF